MPEKNKRAHGIAPFSTEELKLRMDVLWHAAPPQKTKFGAERRIFLR